MANLHLTRWDGCAKFANMANLIEERAMSQSPVPFDSPREEIVEFDGDRLIAVVLDGDGVAVPLRVMCESLDLDPATQIDNIRAHPVLSRGIRMVNVSIGGRVRSVTALIHTMIPYWLATVPPNMVKETSRDKLARYQTEVANVLAQLFYGRDAIPTEPASDPTVAALQQRMSGLLREVRLAREALLAAQQQYVQQFASHQQQLIEQQQQLTDLSEIVAELQNVIPIGPEQAAYLQRAMKHLAHRTHQRRAAAGHTGQTEENLYQLLFGQFKAKFRLPRYDALPARRYEEALAWLKERAAELLPDDDDALPPHQEQLL
jgi:antirepressor protein/ORF6C domain-containing protein